MQRVRLNLILSSLLLLSACLFEDNGTAQQVSISSFTAEARTVRVGDTVRFRWALSSGGEALSCRLEPDDSAPAYVRPCAEREQSHTYTEVGTYAATLSVIGAEDEVRASAKATVEVEAAPPEPAPPITPPVDFSDLTWQKVEPQALNVGEAQGEVVNSKLYVFGGFDVTKACCTPTARAQVYDPATDLWTPIADMPPMNGTTHGGVTHAGMVTDGKDIYFAGGYTSDRDGDGQIFGTPEVWRYDVAEDRYSRLPDLPQTPESGRNNRHSAGQMEFLNGRLHYFGGTSADRKSDVTHHFVLDLDASAPAWLRAAPMPAPRNHLGSAVLNGKIYAVAGQTGHDGGLTTHPDIFVYDPAADVWTAVQPLPKGVSHISSSSFALNGHVVVVGGEVNHLEAVRNVFAYNPVEDTWRSLTDLPVPLRSMVSGAVDGEIFVTGGSGNRRTYRGFQAPQ